MSEYLDQIPNESGRSEEETKLLKRMAKIQGDFTYNIGVILLFGGPLLFLLRRPVGHNWEDMVQLMGFISSGLGICLFFMGRNLKKLSK